MAVELTSCLTAALTWLGVSCASADDLTERCSALSQHAKVSVVFQDGPVITDESLDVQALNQLSGKRAGTEHNVYGFTHAKPYFRVSVVARVVPDGYGQICAMPNISLSLGFSEMVVYLARELTDSCRRNIVWQHEQEHVNTWRAHLRASAQLLTSILLREMGEARTYASRDEAEAGVRAWTEELVTPWVKRILAGVVEAQQAVDTPASYAAVASRLRNCPRAVR